MSKTHRIVYDFSIYEERQLIADIINIYNGCFKDYKHYRKMMDLFNKSIETFDIKPPKHTILSEDIFNYIIRRANNAKYYSNHR